MPVIPYDEHTATIHAELLDHTWRTGHERGPLDLMIAAIARAAGRVLVTTDLAARFDELPGVEVRTVPT
ncbi:hypothetical protein SAMN05421835_11630 [Amycolatopsis sacchari]|uniref:PIN domain-containing protein n=2 Tax=Amycolatopsis sacchari TaxID=115433 RepID=A0A1I3XT84_9PSEU|nr:hypothetical protein SAMN05421835_11630 [Amycolatopsis sacchari]